MPLMHKFYFIGIFMKNFIAIMCVLFLTACSSHNLQNTNFYVLEAPMIEDTFSEVHTKIGVLPINLPSYLDRQQMVLRDENSTQVRIDEYNRWAEHLDNAFLRVLIAALSNELDSENIGVSELTMGIPVDEKLAVSVNSFEGSIGGSVSLNAVWTFTQSSETLLEGHFNSSISAGNDYNSLVSAQSALIQQLAKDIAAKYVLSF